MAMLNSYQRVRLGKSWQQVSAKVTGGKGPVGPRTLYTQELAEDRAESLAENCYNLHRVCTIHGKQPSCDHVNLENGWWTFGFWDIFGQSWFSRHAGTELNRSGLHTAHSRAPSFRFEMIWGLDANWEFYLCVDFGKPQKIETIYHYFWIYDFSICLGGAVVP